VRAAGVADAPAVAALKVRAWRAAYGGVLPPGVLEALDPVKEREAWAGYLDGIPPEDRLWVAVDDGVLVGYTRAGPSPDEDVPPGTGQIHGLYVEPARIGTGLGSLLLWHSLDDLRDRGYVRAVLWHFAGNEVAARFYDRAGIAPDGARRPNELGADEVRRGVTFA
jgi:GNAT superfamily N-acetyltransferase